MWEFHAEWQSKGQQLLKASQVLVGWSVDMDQISITPTIAGVSFIRKKSIVFSGQDGHMPAGVLYFRVLDYIVLEITLIMNTIIVKAPIVSVLIIIWLDRVCDLKDRR